VGQELGPMGFRMVLVGLHRAGPGRISPGSGGIKSGPDKIRYGPDEIT
jgi:hypothetical protein